MKARFVPRDREGLTGKARQQDIEIGDLVGIDLGDIPTGLLSEIGSVRFARALVPFRRENTYAADAFKAKPNAAYPGKKIDERKLPRLFSGGVLFRLEAELWFAFILVADPSRNRQGYYSMEHGFFQPFKAADRKIFVPSPFPCSLSSAAEIAPPTFKTKENTQNPPQKSVRFGYWWWACSCQIRTAHPVRICLLWWSGVNLS